MATLEIRYDFGIGIWEENANGGMHLEIGEEETVDTIGETVKTGRKVVKFGWVPVSDGYDELPERMSDWLPFVAEREGIEQVTLNGSVIWSLAQESGLREILEESGLDSLDIN